MGHMKDSYSSGTILRSRLAVGVLDGLGLRSQSHQTDDSIQPLRSALDGEGL